MADWITQKTHKQFLAGLELSKTAVWLAAQILEDEGLCPTIPVTKAAPTHKDRGKFLDNGDILVGPDKDMVEVKWFTGHMFTSLHDWPHKFVIVYPKKQWNYMGDKPKFWMIFNKTLSHYIKFNLEDIDPNDTTFIYDSRYKVKKEVVKIGNDKVKFLPVPSHILLRYSTVNNIATAQDQLQESYGEERSSA